MNIIFTGHKGLIGTELKKRLESGGHKIILGIDKKEGNDIDVLEKFIPGEKVDLFIHAAALCKINKCIENPGLGWKNAQDTYKVLEFCRKSNILKVVYFSSSRVLSQEKNPYTAGKIYGEELCRAYKECYNIDYLIIRPSTVYGGNFLDETGRLVHIFIKNALLGKDLEIYGNPARKTLDFTHVEDFADGVMLAINSQKWNKEYNISGNQEKRVYDLAEFIIKETGSKSRVIIKNEEIAQPQKVKLDISEIKKLGYNPKVTLECGIRQNIEFYKKLLKDGKLR